CAMTATAQRESELKNQGLSRRWKKDPPMPRARTSATRIPPPRPDAARAQVVLPRLILPAVNPITAGVVAVAVVLPTLHIPMPKTRARDRTKAKVAEISSTPTATISSVRSHTMRRRSHRNRSLVRIPVRILVKAVITKAVARKTIIVGGVAGGAVEETATVPVDTIIAAQTATVVRESRRSSPNF